MEAFWVITDYPCRTKKNLQKKADAIPIICCESQNDRCHYQFHKKLNILQRVY